MKVLIIVVAALLVVAAIAWTGLLLLSASMTDVGYFHDLAVSRYHWGIAITLALIVVLVAALRFR